MSREELQARAFRLRTEGEGLSYAAIGRELGIPAQRAHRLCRSAGVDGVRKRWARWEIIEAIREWELEHGSIPTCEDWERTDRPEWCPTSKTVAARFGSWNAAIREAGFRPRDAGVPEYVHSLGLHLVGNYHRGGTPPRVGPEHPFRQRFARVYAVPVSR